MKEIKAIIFDWGNVIYYWDPNIIANTLSKYSDKSAQKIKAIISKPADLGVKLETGKISPTDFYKQATKKCSININKGKFQKIFIDIFTPIPPVIKLIPKLKKNYKLALLSDISFWHFNYFVKRTPVYKYFDKVTLSYRVGYLKPNKKIYLDALKKLQVKPQECIFIEDIRKNVDGAKKLGINAVQYTTHKNLLNYFKKFDIKC